MDTRSKLLLSARNQIQCKGYNGFSYADLAVEVGIQKASIHHHFSTKADLGREVAIEYNDDFMSTLRQIDSTKKSSIEKLEAYIKLFRRTLEEDHKVCLGVMLAADYKVIPDVVVKEISHFFHNNEAWLEKVLDEGKAAGELEFNSTSIETAKLIFSALEGAMVLAESMKDVSRLESVSQWIISSVKKA